MDGLLGTLTAPTKPPPPEVTELKAFRALRHDRIGEVIHEYQ
jgi:hypothetical protein